MGRLLAIDYGRKRCGLAVTDVLQIVATALDTVPSAQLIPYLKSYLSREQVDEIIVGLPKVHSVYTRPYDATMGLFPEHHRDGNSAG